MTEKKYMFCRLAIIIILSASISISLTLENYLLPIMFILTAMAAMYQCKKEFSKGHVTSDERDYKVAGDAQDMPYTHIPGLELSELLSSWQFHTRKAFSIP